MRPGSGRGPEGTRRVLLTNDDGVTSPGLAILAAEISGAGYDVIVIAPLTDRSGAGASLFLDPKRGIGIQRTRLVGVPEVETIGIDATPAAAVMLAQLGVFGSRPSAVVSGINAGANTGRSILHSGTVGGALAAASYGMSALAVSIDASDPGHLETAARVALEALRWLEGARRRTVLNVNVPDLPLTALKGVAPGRISAYGNSRLAASLQGDYVEMREVPGVLPLDPETDIGLIRSGYVSVTPLQGITAAVGDLQIKQIGAGMFGKPPDSDETAESPGHRLKATGRREEGLNIYESPIELLVAS
jgi:5'-nucleotidase